MKKYNNPLHVFPSVMEIFQKYPCCKLQRFVDFQMQKDTPIFDYYIQFLRIKLVEKLDSKAQIGIHGCPAISPAIGKNCD